MTIWNAFTVFPCSFKFYMDVGINVWKSYCRRGKRDL